MAYHDHPEACQHTLGYCSHCNIAYCTVCGAQWEQVLPASFLAAVPVRSYGPQDAPGGGQLPDPESEHVHAAEGPLNAR